MFYNGTDIFRKGEIAVRGRPSSCAFTGHRPAKLPWGYREEDPRCHALKRRIRDAVESAYEEGFCHFLCGMAQGCDLYFCEVVLALRARHPEVSLEAVVPCPTQADDWLEPERRRYQALLSACDYETLVSDRYAPGCMARRNRYLVDHASLLIAAYDGTGGGTQYTVQYALRRGVEVADLPILLPEEE